jgi:hypothetical protein
MNLAPRGNDDCKRGARARASEPPEVQSSGRNLRNRQPAAAFDASEIQTFEASENSSTALKIQKPGLLFGKA